MKRAICYLRWLCGFGPFHRLYIVQSFSSSERRVACSYCDGDWIMHDGRQAFLPWDADFEQLMQDIGYVIVKPWHRRETSNEE